MKILLFTAFVALGIESNVAGSNGPQRTYPPKYQFSVEDNQSGVNQKNFERVVNMFGDLYEKELNNRVLKWTRDISWENPYIGAGSNQIDGDFYILLYGGLARAKYMNIGALSAVLCHEFGHRFGGKPHQLFPGDSDDHWSSAEGQADTFAASQCLPAIYDYLKANASDLLNIEFENSTLSLCQKAKDLDRCRWVASSGIDLIQAMQVYFDIDIPFAVPSVNASEQPLNTLSSLYPSYQCRMDIYKIHAANPAAPRLRCWYVD